MIRYANNSKKMFRNSYLNRACRCPGIESRMPGKNRFQVIVVGAGLAGTTAAYFLAREGVEVLLLERGLYPGSKNMSGGAIYTLPTMELLPDFWKDAPVERALVDQQYWLMTDNSAVKLGHTNYNFATPPYNKFSVMRVTFDRWYAAKAEEAGACLWTSCKAESLIIKKNKVAGVRVSGSRSGDVLADVVILAEGANPLLAERAGLIKKARAKNYSLYVKQTFAVPEQLINERFHLKDNQGAVIGIFGDNTADLTGTGSIYTFKEHIGINSGISVATLAQKKVNIKELIQSLNDHPVIAPLIKDGTLVEYSAHLIPEGGYNAVPRLVFDGLMIVGDAGGLVNGTHGINLAMYSGKYAADTAQEAIASQDFSLTTLKNYQDRLENSFIFKDMRDNRLAPGFFYNNPTLFEDYIHLMNKVASRVSRVYPIPKKQKRKIIIKDILSSIPAGKLAADLFKTVRVIK